MNLTHGHSHRSHWSPEYTTWWSIVARCSYPKRKDYPRYGGRGIKVCDRWRNSFDNFLVDMGIRPSDQHQIERINNEGNYEPGNCKWATRKEQANNKRNNRVMLYNGESKTLAQWAESIGISDDALWKRLRKGRSLEEAINFHDRRGRKPKCVCI